MKSGIGRFSIILLGCLLVLSVMPVMVGHTDEGGGTPPPCTPCGSDCCTEGCCSKTVSSGGGPYGTSSSHKVYWCPKPYKVCKPNGSCAESNGANGAVACTYHGQEIYICDKGLNSGICVSGKYASCEGEDKCSGTKFASCGEKTKWVCFSDDGGETWRKGGIPKPAGDCSGVYVCK